MPKEMVIGFVMCIHRHVEKYIFHISYKITGMFFSLIKDNYSLTELFENI